MLIFNADEQRFAEENAESNTTTLRFLCENSAGSAFRKLEVGSSPELQFQHHLFDIRHGDAVLFDRF